MVINIVIGAIAFLTYPTWSNFLISFKFIQ
jgi:hypothetical protein